MVPPLSIICCPFVGRGMIFFIPHGRIGAMNSSIRLIRFVFAFLGLLILPPAFLTAHPHVFVDSRVEAEVSGTRLEGFWVEWTFGRFYSAGIIQDFDLDRDGQFNPSEVRGVQQGAFSNLKNYDYFMRLYLDGRELPAVTGVEEFEAAVIDGPRMRYRFFVPLRRDLESGEHKLTVSIFDTTCFSDFSYVEENPAACRGLRESEYRYTIQKNKDRPFYYDPRAGVNQDFDSSVYKPGRLTMYPQELILTFSLGE